MTMNEAQKTRFAQALERVSGDEEMLSMLADIAAEDTPSLLKTLEMQLQSGDLAEAAKTAHALKGLLSTFETGSPVDELQPLIDAARQSDLAETKIVYVEVEPKLRSLLAEILELSH